MACIVDHQVQAPKAVAFHAFQIAQLQKWRASRRDLPLLAQAIA